ncbi:hypothetical protein LEP1GSC047_0563 [Leptospira inadai serovar Lyme str. 10]|uniref:Uncharacterized protein n=2 Tax=Leptospira inadai serovar Lyme TaxID=293084 RepID=V6HA01_9LEPT|nr:hypothetical protein [Leptospira inadai]EQA35887.1 hypothetical protein LEP1GSC047_0563 [Leptospira inadai serovar Lyme str. 10]PNV77020.1 hypothetical protein BES34_001760 [Leptospira inadai serovar Lyme]
MLDPQSPELKVADYNSTLQLAQALEARGDFQYKGIYKLVLIVADWTEKFVANKILPTTEQIARELTLDKERVFAYLKEATSRHNPPLIKKISMVDYDPTGDLSDGKLIASSLRLMTVFARPSQADAGSSHRYVEGVNQTSFTSIQRWIKDRRKFPGTENFQKWIWECIDANRLSETYASSEIGGLFQDLYDTTPALKQTTINIHLKPVLKRLVDSKNLYFFRNERALSPGNRSVFYYNVQDEIIARLELYKKYLKDKIIPELQRIGVLGNFSQEELNNTRALAVQVLPFLSPAYGDQKTAMEELLALIHFEEEEKEKKEKEEKKAKLSELLDYVKSANRLVDLNYLRFRGEPIEDEIRNLIINHEMILHAEFADKKSMYDFVLHKDCIQGAIENAKRVLSATGNDSEIRVLGKMNIKDFLESREAAGQFEKLEYSSLFKYLPFFTRFWRSLFGNNNMVHRFEAEAIRARLAAEQNKRVLEAKTRAAQEEKLRIAEKRVKEKDEAESGAKTKAAGVFAPGEEAVMTRSGEQEADPQAKKMLSSVLDILDAAWAGGEYPDRNYLLTMLGADADENTLLNFLKKNAKKEIHSFMVRNQEEKYTFPILITRRFLKKNGRSLLDKAKKIVDEQKVAGMPEQEKFDFYISFEDFLNRTLAKI